MAAARPFMPAPFPPYVPPPPTKRQSFVDVFLWTWIMTTIGTGLCGGICLLYAGPFALFGLMFGAGIGFFLGIPVGLVLAAITVARCHPLANPVHYARWVKGFGVITVFLTLGVANAIMTLNELDAYRRYPARSMNGILAWDAWSLAVSVPIAYLMARTVARRYIADWRHVQAPDAPSAPVVDERLGYGYDPASR